jgi:hypothetical protein
MEMVDLLAEVDFKDTPADTLAHNFFASPDGKFLIFKSTRDPRKPMVYVFRNEK